MAQELRAFTVNMKTLDQDIEDPVIAGGGDVNGRIFRIIFTQEAATQITPSTKVYLSWRHMENDVRGLNIFTQKSEKPAIWEISYPRAMLLEGNVQCCIKLVDEVSIVQSADFVVHVLTDPDDGSHFVVSDDYSEFQQAIIDMAMTKDKMEKELERWQQEYNSYAEDITRIENTANSALTKADTAIGKADTALEKIETSVQGSIEINEFE